MEYRVCVAVELTHGKTLKKWSFEMEYRVCVAVESRLDTHTNFIVKRKTYRFLQCNIVFM